jgi:hypothetical protein
MKRSWNSNGALLLAWAILFAAVLGYYTGPRWLAVVTVTLLDGSVALAWAAAGAALGWVVLRLMRFDVRGTLALATSAGLGLGILSLLVLALGLMGAANQVSMLVLMGASVALGIGPAAWKHRHRLTQPMGDRLSAWLAEPAGARWMWLAIAPLAGIAVSGACIMPGLLWKPDDPHPYDVLVYHLQVPREWFEAGRIIELPHNVYSYFPFNIEMHFLAMMHLKGGPWDGMYAAQFMSLMFAIIAVLAVKGALEVPAGRVAGVVAAGLPWVVLTSCVAYVESGLIAYAALCIAWILRAEREDRIKCLMVAGAMVGFACGVKWTAVAFVAAAGGVAVLMGGRKRLAGAAVFAGVTLIVVSPWMIRNFAWTGNPVFPVAMRVLGQGHFTDEQVARFDRAHGPREDQRSLSPRLAAGWREIGAAYQYGYLLWPLATVAIALRLRDRRVWMLAAMLVVMLVCWLAVTHLMSRFFVTAIPAAVLLVGILAEDRFARLALAPLAVLIAVIGWSGVHERFAGFAEVARNGFFGITKEDVAEQITPELIQHLAARDGEIYFVGDSQVFLIQVPMTRLKYRTVFDIDTREKPSAIEAWMGVSQRPADASIFVNPDENERLARTYGIPELPPEYRRREHFVIEPDGTIIAPPASR